MSTPTPWPPAVDRLLGGPTDDGPTVCGPGRWRVGRMRVERLEDPGITVEVLEGLAGALPVAVPQVVGVHGSWLVTTAPAGEPADRPDRHPEPGRLAAMVGEGLAGLHRIDPALIPGRSTESGPVAERCAAALADGRAARADLAEPYRRYEPDALLALATDGPGLDQAGPDGSDGELVFSHGWPTLDRFLVEGNRLVGIDGFGSALVADRHLDLAIVHLSVGAILGQEAVFGFYEAYGRDPDLVRLDRGVLVAHLLGAVPPVDQSGP